MHLEHQFTVPAPVDVAWRVLLDVQRVAPCFPGATLTGVSGDSFTGSVRVRLGPVSLQYKGSGRFLERDEAAGRMVMEASGKDARGQGTATATVTANLVATDGGTEVTVHTDLNITGRPAQLGQRMINDVGGRIVNSFAESLAGMLATEPTATSDEHTAVVAPSVAGTRPTTNGQPEPQAELDLLQVAGAPLAKRILPAVAAFLGVWIVIRAIRRRRRP